MREEGIRCPGETEGGWWGDGCGVGKGDVDASCGVMSVRWCRRPTWRGTNECADRYGIREVSWLREGRRRGRKEGSDLTTTDALTWLTLLISLVIV